MKHLSLLSVLLLLGFFSVRAQNTFTNQVTISGQTPPPPVHYDILKILSAGSGKPIRNIIYTITADQSMRNGFNGGKYTFGVLSKPLAINGDVYYKGFNIASSLMPSSVSFTLKITSGNFSKEFPLNATLSADKPADVSATYADTTGRNYNFSVINYKVTYTAEDVRNLQRKADFINEYYAKTIYLDQQFAVLQAIDPYDYNLFRTIFPRLDAAQKVIDDINKANYSGLLQLNNGDPARLNEKLSAYSGLLQAKRAEANQVFSTLHLVFQSRGNDAMRDGNNALAYDLYHIALELNPAFAPAMLQLARIDFIRRDFKESQCKAEEILYRMLPDPATRSNTIDLLLNIQEVYTDEGKTFQLYKQYDKAIEQYEMAKDICKRFPEIRCTNDIYLGIEAGHKGNYGNILQDARAAIQRSDFVIAERKVDEAIRYWKNNLKLLGEPNEAYEVQKLVRQKKYDNLVLFGKQLNDRNDYEKAVSKFTEADNLQQQYNLTVSGDYDKQSKIAAKNYMVQLMDNGETAVKINNLTSARAALNAALDLQSRFNLQNETALTKRSDALREQIYGQECINAQFSIDSATAAGRLYVKQTDYLNAYNVLTAGLNAKGENPNCRLSTDSLEALLYRIRPAGVYLKMMQDVSTEISNGNYQSAISIYTDAGKHFNNQHVDAFKLQHNFDRDNFVINSNNNGLLNYIAEADMKSGRLDNSLRLYKLLLERNVDVKAIEGSLYQLGYKTGISDKQSAPGGNGKKLAARYTQGDKRLKRFEKGFVKGYK